jgi:hypothetical protein
MRQFETIEEGIMTNDPLRDCPDDELERRVADLESEEWFGVLKRLKPRAASDLYSIGFEAGKQSINPTLTSFWLHARTAICSSVVSVAATLLFFVTLPEGASNEADSAASTEVTAQLESPSVEIKDAAKHAGQSTTPMVNDVFAELPNSWRDRLQTAELNVPSRSDSQHVVDIEPSRLRYAFQRRQLIENLQGSIQ